MSLKSELQEVLGVSTGIPRKHHGRGYGRGTQSYWPFPYESCPSCNTLFCEFQFSANAPLRKKHWKTTITALLWLSSSHCLWGSRFCLGWVGEGRLLLRESWGLEHKVPSPVLSFVHAWRWLLAGDAHSFRPMHLGFKNGLSNKIGGWIHRRPIW